LYFTLQLPNFNLNYFKSVLLLSRPLNQIFIVLTMMLVRYCVVLPELNIQNIEPILNNFWFGLLIVSLVLISAAGYLINDYFDVKADELNKPQKLIVGRHMKRRVVMATQMTFNLSGLTIGCFCAIKAGNTLLFLFHLVAAVLLWYYSVYFKKQPFIGNLIVSILVALVVIVVVAFEYHNNTSLVKNKMWYYAYCYGIFAFLSNLIRELIKDAEDIEGDKLINANTLPIKYGIHFTIKIVISLTVFLIALVGCFCFIEFSKQLSTSFSIMLSTFCSLPFVSIFLFVRKADTQQQFKKISSYLKLLIFFGIMSMLFI